MTPALVYGAGLAICVIGLAVAAYLLGVPAWWIVGAALFGGAVGAAIARRRARRRAMR